MHICVHTYICIFGYTYVYTCVCMYTHTYIYHTLSFYTSLLLLVLITLKIHFNTFLKSQVKKNVRELFCVYTLYD